MKKVLAIILVLFVVIVSMVKFAEAFGFKCSVCGSTSHGSLWHDSDKDGVNDR